MNDTTPRAAAEYARRLMERSGADRLRMASSAFDSAREMVLAGIHAQRPGLSEPELRIELLLRTYGADLSPHRLQQVIERIRGGLSRGKGP